MSKVYCNVCREELKNIGSLHICIKKKKPKWKTKFCGRHFNLKKENAKFLNRTNPNYG